MRKFLAVLVVVLIAGAFLAGYWPQHERAVRAQAEAAGLKTELEAARTRLAEVEAQARLGRLFGQLLALQEAVGSGNFGEAQTLSSALFDGVREESGATRSAQVRTSLEAILARRDTVTAGLARSDASVRTVLAPIERELRRALGYPVPPLAAAKPQDAEARP
jgi:hypothetical protein